MVRDFPEFYSLYSLKEYSYNGIKQPNRNRLLYMDATVDGMKTGHTETAGVSRMTIAVEADELGARRIEANLYKLLEVLRVDNVTRQPSIVKAASKSGSLSSCMSRL